MVGLYLLSLGEAEKIPQSLAEAYFPKRLLRAARYAKREDRLRCIGAGALLAYAFGACEDRLSQNGCGKPFFIDGGNHFNLSHNGDYIALATDDTEIGADIQKIAEPRDFVAQRLMQKEEYEWMMRDSRKRFYTLWTLKESVIKQCGLGFSLPMPSFSVLPLTAGSCISVENKTLFARTVEYDGYMLSVCAAHPIELPKPSTVTADIILKRLS